MIQLALILFLFVFASPSAAEPIGVLRSPQGETITLDSKPCAQVGAQPKGLVQWHDTARKVKFVGCWMYRSDTGMVLIDWEDGDVSQIELSRFKEPEGA